MRALLVVNPSATTTSARTRDVLVHALASDLKLEVATTEYRGHARDLARAAAESGNTELVVALGGDGTVNEVVNGLLHRGPDPEGLPRLAVVPGGSTNVFARALGLPNEPVEATGALLDALRDGTGRTIGLGHAGGTPGTEDEGAPGRWFTFCAGFGFDAGVVGAGGAAAGARQAFDAFPVRATVHASVPGRVQPPARDDHPRTAGRGATRESRHVDNLQHLAVDVLRQPADLRAAPGVLRHRP
ncbi:hypothetical protein GCM10020221_24030 [Streptomyces thioluteus]|uniref:DAGKc domain-containing protein n=1 Tax=Streptomyces thioluteus TaxID=66431 RepID=A0ABN3WTB0_STRTU